MTDTLKFEAGKEYLLRNGWRMICYRISDYETARSPIRGVLRNTAGYEQIETWTASGANDDGVEDGRFDIISEAPEPIEVDRWLWVYTGRKPILESEPWFCESGFEYPDAQIRIKRTVQHGEGM